MNYRILTGFAAGLFATAVVGATWHPARTAPLATRGAPAHSPSSPLVVRDSGATNLYSGKTITFGANGSARLLSPNGVGRSFSHATFKSSVASITTLVNRAGGVENIRSGVCMRSASFGHSVWLSMGGHTSGDLTCLAPHSSSAARTVARTVLALESRVVKLAVSRSGTK